MHGDGARAIRSAALLSELLRGRGERTEHPSPQRPAKQETLNPKAVKPEPRTLKPSIRDPEPLKLKTCAPGWHAINLLTTAQDASLCQQLQDCAPSAGIEGNPVASGV